jgi:drug/metabolite transporter (DMT)-like permease
MTRGSLPVIYTKLLLTAIFWGGTFIAGRVVARNVGPYSASFLRFAIASVFFLILIWKSEGKLSLVRKNQILPIILLGMTGIFFYNVFFFKGLKIINAGRASLIIANNPVFISLLSAYFFKEKLHILRLIGIFISVTGAMIVISRGNLLHIMNGNLGWGELYIFLCVISWVAFSLIGKLVMAGLSPLISVSYSSIAGSLALFVPACSEGIVHDFLHYPYVAWISTFYLSIFGTVLGFLWYYEGIKKIGPLKASQFINFVPISAVLLAFFILGEPLTGSLIVGLILVTSGVYLTNRAYMVERI